MSSGIQGDETEWRLVLRAEEHSVRVEARDGGQEPPGTPVTELTLGATLEAP